jgi:hypothetical protein
MTTEPKGQTNREASIIELLQDNGLEIQVNGRAESNSLELRAMLGDQPLLKLIFCVQVVAPKVVVSGRSIENLLRRYRNQNIAAFWIVADSFSSDARGFGEQQRVRLFNVAQLRRAILGSDRLVEQKTGSRTIAKKLQTNRAQICTMAAALVLLVDERLSNLRSELPNSEAAKSARDGAIAQLERIRIDVAALAEAAANFKEGTSREQEAIEAAITFTEGVQKWWNKSHAKICEKACDMGLFGLAVSICSLAGSGGKMAVAVSAAMIGGKQLSDALKGFKGIWK